MMPEDLASRTVKEIRALINALPAPEEDLLRTLENDTRAGVQNLAKTVRRQRQKAAEEQARLERMCVLENELRARGERVIAGVDEAGRGPLAGPVVAAAVALPPDTLIEGLDDSKKLSEARREALFDDISRVAQAVGVGRATPEEIDRLNIRNATHLAMRRAIDALGTRPDRILVDGNAVPESAFPERAIIGGDRLSLSIAAASIIAKVTRDREMIAFDAQYPAYGFAKHKGYGSPDHLEAIREHGPCPIHRKTFGGVAEHAQSRSEDFQVFAQGIKAASNPGELAAIGQSISSASSLLPKDELSDLRRLYRTKRDRLAHPGISGERLAEEHLAQKGYEIIARRYRGGGGEIDLIANHGHALVFVEVKTATTDRFGAPESWVTAAKQAQIRRVARAFLKDRKEALPSLRFDVVAIRLTGSGPEIHHIENAFANGP